jgi:hypothetical protein
MEDLEVELVGEKVEMQMDLLEQEQLDKEMMEVQLEVEDLPMVAEVLEQRELEALLIINLVEQVELVLYQI